MWKDGVGRGGEEKGHGKGHAAATDVALPNFADVDVAALTGGQFEGAYHRRPHPPVTIT